MLINAGKIWLCWNSGWWVAHLTLSHLIPSWCQGICQSRRSYRTLGLWRLFAVQLLRSKLSMVTMFSSRELFTTRMYLNLPLSCCSTGIILWEFQVVTQSKWLNKKNATFTMGKLNLWVLNLWLCHTCLYGLKVKVTVPYFTVLLFKVWIESLWCRVWKAPLNTPQTVMQCNAMSVILL